MAQEVLVQNLCQNVPDNEGIGRLGGGEKLKASRHIRNVASSGDLGKRVKNRS